LETGETTIFTVPGAQLSPLKPGNPKPSANAMANPASASIAGMFPGQQ
jgi:hypothetical protein